MKKLKRGMATALCGSLVLNMAVPAFGDQANLQFEAADISEADAAENQDSKTGDKDFQKEQVRKATDSDAEEITDDDVLLEDEIVLEDDLGNGDSENKKKPELATKSDAEGIEEEIELLPEQELIQKTGIYEITYDYNGIIYNGETSMVSQVPVGETLNEGDNHPYFRDDPTETGNKLFMGWTTESGKFIEKNELYRYTPTGDETLTAVWSDYYEVEIDYNGPEGGQYKNRKYYIAQGKKFGYSPSTPSEEYDGKIFAGWYSEATKKTYGDSGSDSIYNYVPTQDDRLIAQWASYYTVTFDPNGGELDSYMKATELVVEGRAVTKAYNNVKRDGYVFAGWKIAGTDIFIQNNVYVPTGDVTLVAQWAEYWTVTYDANGGVFKSGASTSQNVEMGSSLSLMGEYYISRDGYVFVGWCENPEGTGTVYSGSYKPQGNITLYAKWGKYYEVILDAGEGNFGSSSTKTVKVVPGNTIGSNLANPLRNGYGFGGWYLDEAYTQRVNYSFEPKANVRLYAKWIEGVYTVTLHAGGNYISTDTPGSYVSERSVQVAPGCTIPHISVYRDNYTLSWYLDEDCTKPITSLTSYIPTGDTELYAQWKKNIKVIWEADGGRDSSGNARGIRTIAEGESISLPSVKKDGYALEGWFTEDGTEITKTTNLYENVSVTARWSKGYKVVLELDGGSISSTYLPYTYVKENGTFSPGTPKKEGFAFAGWLSSADGNVYTSLGKVKITQDMTFTAQWVDGHRVTLHANGGYLSTDNGYRETKQVVVADGKHGSTALFGTPRREEALQFLGWSEKPDGSADDVITLNSYAITGDIDLYAVWGEYWTITAVLNGGHHSNNTENQVTTFKVAKGREATSLKADNMSKDGFSFAGWYLTPDFSGDPITIPGFVPTSDTWIYAKWIPGNVKLWTVHFETNGGNDLSDVQIMNGAKLSAPSEPNRAGYIFNGWYTDAECTKLYDFEDVVTADLTLYADWTETTDLKDADLSIIGSYTYTGEWIVPDVEVRIGGKRLTRGLDYTVSAEDNLHAGTAKVTVTATGSRYVGAQTISFIIERAEAPAPALPSEPLQAVWGMELNELNDQLPAGWKWYRSGSSKLNQVGNREEIVIFPAPSSDYKEKRTTIVIQVAQKSIEGAEIILTKENGQEAEEFVYEEGGVKPNVKVTLDGKRLTEYEVLYEDNEAVGTATVIVRGTGNYTGGVRKTFTIKHAEPVLDIANKTYEAHYGDFLNWIELPEGWSWQNGTAQVGAVTGTGYREFLADYRSSSPNYADKMGVKLKVKVLPKRLRASNGIRVELSRKYYVDDGMPHEPKVTVTDVALSRENPVILKEGVDYTVRYMFSQQVSGTGGISSAYAEIHGMGNYTDTILSDYYILADPYDLSKADVSVETPVAYTGEALEPQVHVTAGFLDEEQDRLITKELEPGIDYTLQYENNIEPGYGKVTVIGTGSKGNGTYYGSQTKNFRIEAVDYTIHAIYGDCLKDLTLPADWTWKDPDLFVGDVTGNEGRAFEAYYESEEATDRSEFLVVVSPKYIDDSSVKLLDWTGEGTYTEEGSKAHFRLHDEKTGKDLVEGKDYEVSGDLNAGENQPFVIRGVNNYTGMLNLTYTIHPAAPEPELKAEAVKNGRIELTVKQKPFFLYAAYKGDGEISFASDRESVFIVEKKTNDYGEENDGYLTVTGIGTAVLTVTVNATQNYKEAVKTYDVIVHEANIENSSIELSKTQYTYTGEQICPEFIVSDDGEVLHEGIDYVVLYGENVKAGKNAGSITVQGIGNYSGYAAISFDILKAENPVAVPKITIEAGYGQKVSEFSLPDGWRWKEPDMILSSTGKVLVKAVLPETGNYLAKEMEVEFIVSKSQNPDIPDKKPDTSDSTPDKDTDSSTSDHSGSESSKSTSVWVALPEGYQGATKSLYGITVPDYVIDGNWRIDDFGNWSFSDKFGNTYADSWRTLYNGYSNRNLGQLPYGWFLFDERGYMRTGWVTEKDGKIYYLNAESDNTKGMMVTGWKQIDGKWYYFSEKWDESRGQLLRATVTPDGYTVDENGVWNGERAK